MAQSHLMNIGYNLGASGADGDWGSKSQEAAIAWQKLNGYEETGDLTLRQLDALEFQSQNPEVLSYTQLQDFYDNFDPNTLGKDIDPGRAAIVMQAAAHVGVKEVEANDGVGVEQYYSADPRMRTGYNYCSTFGGWVDDQIEKAVGLENNEHTQASMRTREVLETVRETSPQAVKSLLDYEPEAADMLLLVRADGTGHYMTIAGAMNTTDGDTLAATIEGNTRDSVGVGERAIYTDPESGRSFLYEADPDDPTIMHVNWDDEIFVVDRDELPNFDKISTHFNNKAFFTPTASIDPDFQANIEELQALKTMLTALNEYKENRDNTFSDNDPNMDHGYQVPPLTPISPGNG